MLLANRDSDGFNAVLAKALVNLADRLPKSLAVFNDCHSQPAFAVVSETSTRAHRDSAFVQEFHREFDRTHVTPFLGHLCPNEHASFWWSHFPAQTIQAFAQDIATALILFGHGFNGGIAVTHGHDGRNLYGLKDAVVVVTFDANARTISLFPQQNPIRHPAML